MSLRHHALCHSLPLMGNITLQDQFQEKAGLPMSSWDIFCSLLVLLSMCIFQLFCFPLSFGFQDTGEPNCDHPPLPAAMLGPQEPVSVCAP